MFYFPYVTPDCINRVTALQSDVIIRLLIDASEFVYNDSKIKHVRNLAK